MIQDHQNRFGDIWFIPDLCGILCCVFTWILIIYAQYSVITCIILPEPDVFYKTTNFIIFELLLILASVSHIKCVFNDPGSIPRGSATREAIESLGLDEDSVKILFKCQKCCAIKPERAHHCSVCNCCIRKMDHHCPWVNNCIGELNQKYFLLFTFYIALVSTYTLVITVLHLINCIKNDWSHCDSRPLFSMFTSEYYSPPIVSEHASPYSIILIIVLIFESLLFAIFTIIMFSLQVIGIYKDETGIESLKKENRHNRHNRNVSFTKRFKIMLAGFNLNWLNPFTSIPQANSLDFKNYTHYV